MNFQLYSWKYLDHTQVSPNADPQTQRSAPTRRVRGNICCHSRQHKMSTCQKISDKKRCGFQRRSCSFGASLCCCTETHFLALKVPCSDELVKSSPLSVSHLFFHFALRSNWSFSFHTFQSVPSHSPSYSKLVSCHYATVNTFFISN